jgi:hypothetical protein
METLKPEIQNTMHTDLVQLELSLKIQRLLSLVGGIGVAAIFLPYTYNISPFEAVMEPDFWRLAAPALLPLLVFILSLRWLFIGILSVPERVISYIVASASISITIYVYIMGIGLPDSIMSWLGYILPFSTLGSAIFIVIRTRKNSAITSFRPIMTLQFAYLVNSLLCLCAFYDELQIGGWLTLGTVFLYIIQISLVCSKTKIMGKR